MFFYIGNNCPLLSLNKVDNRLFLDKGWNQKDNIWYKGYSVDCNLSNSLSDILDGYQPSGKWCVIHEEKVYHPVLRGFPFYERNDEQTNLLLDEFVEVQYNRPSIINNSTLSLDDASVIIGDILLENVTNFYKYNNINTMNVLYTAGLDTLTTWAVIDSYTKDYTLNAYITKPDDDTIPKKLGRIRDYENDLTDFVSTKHWGYSISSVFTNVNWYATGYYAEVYHYRDAEAINALANYHGKHIHKLAKDTDYLYWFLKRPSVVEKYKDSMINFIDEDELRRFLYSTIFTDYQYWHLDNNMTFSPFADIRIPQTIHRMSIEDITLNCVNGITQRKIVERFNPQLLPLLADYKNEKSVWRNFKNNFKNVRLDSKVNIRIR
jgi:hypothetical protein